MWKIGCLWHAGIARQKYIPSKVSLLAWRLFQNKLATNDYLIKRGVLNQNMTHFVGGCNTEESATRLFLWVSSVYDCMYAMCSFGVNSVVHNDEAEHIDQYVRLIVRWRVVEHVCLYLRREMEGHSVTMKWGWKI